MTTQIYYYIMNEKMRGGGKMKKLALKMFTILAIAIVIFIVKQQFLTGATDKVQLIIGLILVLVSLGYLFYETKQGLPFFYGQSQSAGSNANGSIVAGVGIGILATSFVKFLGAYILVVLYLFVLTRLYDHKSNN